MNPFWLLSRIAVMALMPVAAASLLIKKLTPKPEDLVAGAIHFRNSFVEFQKGVTTVLLGSAGPSSEEIKKERESRRIPID
jgi:hypothetical protein